MKQNIFKELQEKKQKLLSLAEKAVEFGWIPLNKAKKASGTALSFEEIKNKLEKDTLTIGVIGQMKCGKSTFLNSFVFEDNVLPAATTPMTAALSVITYGEKERVVAEFYNKDEWEEQKMQADRSIDEAENPLDESKIKAAKELVSKAKRLGSSLENLLGKTTEDTFENLIEYVGAEGKYVSITKCVTIYYPKEYLKGVEIVDTPGFNDPVVSREERTKEFLKKADVVLMMLYAGRPFDATDRDIIFKNVRQCGIGKVLVAINKYDIPYCSEVNPEDENQIKDYVKDGIRKACRECNDMTLVEILNDVEPIPLSAEMALLSQLPMSKIASSDVFDFSWKRHCSNFGISTQSEMRKWSHLDDLVIAVKEMVDKEKNSILFAKPVNAIIAAGQEKLLINDNDLRLQKSKLELLRIPDIELENKDANLTKCHKRLSKKIDTLGDEIDSELRDLIRRGGYELEDIVDASCKRMLTIIRNDWPRHKSYSYIAPRINREINEMITRKLKRATDEIAASGEKEIKRCISDFFEETEGLLMRYLPDFDSEDFIKTVKKKILLDIEENDLFSAHSEEERVNYGWGDVVIEFIRKALNMLNLIPDPVINLFVHGDYVIEAENKINAINSDFNPKPYLELAFLRKEEVIGQVRHEFITNLIEPLQKQIMDIRSKLGDKEKEIATTETTIKTLEANQERIKDEIQTIEEAKVGIV